MFSAGSDQVMIVFGKMCSPVGIKTMSVLGEKKGLSLYTQSYLCLRQAVL